MNKPDLSEFDDFDKIFSYDHLYESYRKSRKGVSWKDSVQKYITNAPTEVEKTFQKLHNGKFKTCNFFEFNISERGKVRHIKSVVFNERVVQKCLCDYSLTPMLEREFIYDNGASTKYKGYTFAINRITKHLQRHLQQFGEEGYILLFDFSKFFDSVDHEYLKQELMKRYTDNRTLDIIFKFIDAFEGGKGLGLGSQISQVLALLVGNKLDHYCKEKLHIKGYGRYMDDGYLIHKDKEYLKYCLKEIETICNECKLNLNLKKTQIVKFSKGFTYLNCKFHIVNGKVIKTPTRKTITRARRKLKKLKERFDKKEVPIEHVNQSVSSTMGYLMNFKSYRSRQNLNELYYKLFEGEKDVLQNCKKWKRH